MDPIEMNETAARERPKGIALLALLQSVGGAILIVTVLLGYQDVSETLSNVGLSWRNLSVASFLYGLLGIAAGIGIWRGKRWGWWLTAFSYFYGILRNVSALVMIPGMLETFGEPDGGTGYYYAREIGQIGVGVAITAYWLSEGIRDYFDLSELSRRRAVLTLTAVSIAVIGASYLLPGAVDRDLEPIAQLYEQGDVLATIDELEQYLESHPDNDLAWALLGHANQDVEDFEGAQAAYDRALEINPERVEAWVGQGILHRKLGDPEQAMQCYEQALAIDPNNADAYGSMAALALQTYQDAKALEYAEKAYELDRRSPVVAANLAVIYHYNEMYEERDAMTAEAEKLGYEGIDSLQLIYDGVFSIRE
jgi:tetratricopeptide (TPR) repeat protein